MRNLYSENNCKLSSIDFTDLVLSHQINHVHYTYEVLASIRMVNKMGTMWMILPKTPLWQRKFTNWTTLLFLYKTKWYNLKQLQKLDFPPRFLWYCIGTEVFTSNLCEEINSFKSSERNRAQQKRAPQRSTGPLMQANMKKLQVNRKVMEMGMSMSTTI